MLKVFRPGTLRRLRAGLRPPGKTVEVKPESISGETIEMLECAVEDKKIVLKWGKLAVPFRGAPEAG